MNDFQKMKNDPDGLFEDYLKMLLDGESLNDSQLVMFEYLKKGKNKPIPANMSATAHGSGEVKF